MTERTDLVRTPFIPRYAEVRHLLTLLDGVLKPVVTGLIQSLHEQMGTPQDPVDWSNPDTWIPERLTGDQAALAWRIWQQTEHTVSPRYLDGSYYLIDTEGSLVPDSANVYRLSDRGKAFLQGDPALLREVDTHEGLLQLLQMLATKTRAMRGDVLPEWSAFLVEHSRLSTPTTAKHTLQRRLRNLIERGFVLREGNTYSITLADMAYVGSESVTLGGASRQPSITPLQEVAQSVQVFNQKQREALRGALIQMRPYRFEQLVRDLLEAMGYDNVEVTRESGDKGVDVVATIEFGITTIIEVVQVKRHQGNIQRPVLDQLRGHPRHHHYTRRFQQRLYRRRALSRSRSHWAY